MTIDKAVRVANLVSSARDYIKQGRISEAEAAIATLEERCWGGLKTMRMRASVQKMLSQKAHYGETLRRIAEHDNCAPSDRFRLAAHLIDCGDIEGARDAAAPLQGREDCRHLTLNLLYLTGLRAADMELARRALFEMLELDARPPTLPELRLVLNELPVQDRRLLEDAIAAKWPERSGLEPETRNLPAGGGEAEEELRRALALMPPPDARLRPLIEDNGDSVIVSPRGSSGTTLLVFTGLADQAMVPITGVDAFCAAQGHSAIYLRDTSRSLFIGGVPALGQDFSSSLNRLKEISMQLGTVRLLGFGSSAGGFAAIRYGLALSASEILCASAATCSTPQFLEQHSDIRGRMVSRRLQRTFSTAQLDLYDEVADAQGRTTIRLCFGAGSAPDVAHAHYLKGLPGVSVHPLAGLNRHGSFPRMILEGIFQDFLPGGNR